MFDELLAAAIAVGVLTLGTIALLNTSGQRLHDVCVRENRTRFTYRNGKAAQMRQWFSMMPVALMTAVILYIAFVWWVHSRLPCQTDIGAISR